VTRILDGKVALITGASRGIGEALARRFAYEGAHVIVAARTSDPGSRLPGSLRETIDAIEAYGGEATGVQVDLSVADDRARLVAEASGLAGTIDILVNNAAVSWFHPVAEFPAKHLQLMWELQVRAPFELSQLVLPGMIGQGRGWILNVSSGTASHPVGPPYDHSQLMPGGTAYGMCKAALERFSTGLASEVEGTGVAVNSLAPSKVVATWGTEHHSLVPTDQPQMIEYPEEFAEVALALCAGDPATTTGRVVRTDELLAELGGVVMDLEGRPFVRPEVVTS
jgi:citronellol/citronellal dehydrogenase